MQIKIQNGKLALKGLNVTLTTADLNDDNRVDIADFGILVNEYGSVGDL